MKAVIIVTACVVMGSGVFAQNLSPSLEPFKFLLGTWSFKNDQEEFLEVWELKDFTTLIGRGYKINRGDTSLLEAVLLTSQEDGIYYIPSVENQKDNGSVRFKLVSSSDHTYIFESKAHDFPQRIVYKIKGDNGLLAWIEGTKNGKVIRKEFPYSKKEVGSNRKN